MVGARHFRTDRLGGWLRLAIPLCFLAFLEFGIVEAAIRRISLTGSYEESLGYRYFYTLRLLYADDIYVFTAQGQLMDLLHQGIQVLMTQCGFPVLELFPRIELFSYASVMCTHLLAFATLAYATWGVRSRLAAATLAVAMAAPYFIPSLWGFYILLQPDYQPWLVIAPLLALGQILRLGRGPQQPWRFRDTLALGGILAFALGVKLTLVVYPLIVALAQLTARNRSWRSLFGAGCGIALGLAGWGLILAALYHGRLELILRFLHDQHEFGAAVRPDRPYLTWLASVLLDSPWVVRACVLLPVGLALNFLRRSARKQWPTASGLLAGAVGYHYFLYLRYQPVSSFEATLFLVFALLLLLLDPAADRSPTQRWRCLALIILGGVQWVIGAYHLQFRFIPYLVQATRAQASLATSLQKYHDRIAFLIPDNSYRPLTVDSAIWKGGSDVQIGSNFPSGALIQHMFPRRQYFVRIGKQYPRLDLSQFEAVVFVVNTEVPSNRLEQESAMLHAYRIDPAAVKLRATFTFNGQDVLLWEVAPRRPAT